MAYAFDGCDPEERAKVGVAWTARNVVPILYDPKDDHSLLCDTFRKWVDVRRYPKSRARIALDGIQKLAGPPDDREAARVTWALEQPEVAWELAQGSPFTDEQDFPKIERWLDVFAEAGLLNGVVHGPDTTDRPVHLVVRWIRLPESIPPRRGHLSVGLLDRRASPCPQVLNWVLRNGGRVHPKLRWEIRRNLADPVEAIPPRLRHLWTVVLGEQEPDPRSLLFLKSSIREPMTPRSTASKRLFCPAWYLA